MFPLRAKLEANFYICLLHEKVLHSIDHPLLSFPEQKDFKSLPANTKSNALDEPFCV